MGRDLHLNELGEFLKARRAGLNPADVGLPATPGQPRRVAGLRREEVALLASISTEYYARIEQGRLQASTPVLADLARVLRLNADQRAYLFELAAKNELPAHGARQQVDPQLQFLLDDLATTPAVVSGRRTDVLAWNRLAAALIADYGNIPEERRTFIRMLFTDPALRALYADWEEVAHVAIAQVRMESARYPGDPTLTALVNELSAHDAQFRQWWTEHQVAGRTTGIRRLRHPVIGEVTLDWNTFTSASDPDQKLIVWTAPPGSPAHDALRLLASWAADQDLRASRNVT
ncbi:helix-turn-helix domain-containing protein [Streptomyces arenae]|uniref:helix-turn-helix domain-containing protein n=1 Tax=Streptomyces arenae TaxID=29301 RepID=UPI002658D0F4|nr:helix-turn-helix domain-containing protein [Streptomyces arenae]MCG7202266.1 helix-turn-helix domain-containing protein [Streptomyces arenae]